MAGDTDNFTPLKSSKLNESKPQQQQQQQSQRSKSSLSTKGKRNNVVKDNNVSAEPSTVKGAASPLRVTTILSRANKNSIINNSNSSSNTRGENTDVDKMEQISSLSNDSVNNSQRKAKASPSFASGTPNRRRHQYNDSVDDPSSKKVIAILQRPKSSTDLVNSAVNNVNTNNTKKSLETLREVANNDVKSDRQQQQRRSSPTQQNRRTIIPNAERSTVTRRSDIPSSKAKRVQRRKEIKLMVEAIDNNDVTLSVSPPQSEESPSLQQQSLHHQMETPTDVNSITIDSYKNRIPNSPTHDVDFILTKSPSFPALSAPKNDLNNNEISSLVDINSNVTDDSLFERSLSKNFKRHSDNFVKFNNDVPIPNIVSRRQSSTAIELQSQIADFAEYANTQRPSSASAKPSSSPSKMLTSKLYAGPEFHNSPAPSDLPLPSFIARSTESPELPSSRTITPPLTNSGNRSEDENMFVMDDDDYLAKDNASEGLPSPMCYNIPARMNTARPLIVYPSYPNGANLIEISESIRSMLKIQ
ncbi:4419_t:CDS:2 [Ambispora leptoticha]|uniref:4419_t:CDS:1 n=1 Tax=Ambispora leptoticha TaxID=144679 RepID=A0A9N8VFI6_9GLOM|nr:4419_t:CDS:2 [Ambispora leptoticha]